VDRLFEIAVGFGQFAALPGDLRGQSLAPFAKSSWVQLAHGLTSSFFVASAAESLHIPAQFGQRLRKKLGPAQDHVARDENRPTPAIK
jgi:hypothetical protein